jgi:hypothetical protein
LNQQFIFANSEYAAVKTSTKAVAGTRNWKASSKELVESSSQLRLEDVIARKRSFFRLRIAESWQVQKRYAPKYPASRARKDHFAMEMVAASKMRRAQDRMELGKPIHSACAMVGHIANANQSTVISIWLNRAKRVIEAAHENAQRHPTTFCHGIAELQQLI